MARRSRAWSPARWWQFLRQGFRQPKGMGLQYFLYGWSGCSRRKKWVKRQKVNLLFTSLVIFRASHICQVGSNHLPPCVYFLIYKYWFGLGLCFEIAGQGAPLSPFWWCLMDERPCGGPPGPQPSLYHICHLYYLQHLELPLKLLFEGRIPWD